MNKFPLLIFAILINLSLICCVLLKLEKGIIRGRISKSPKNPNKLFYAFQEIPYATPPVGELRFQPPQSELKWNGILNNVENSKICYQCDADSEMENEDCLYLNVYSPKLPTKHETEYLPIMFYIHGGGYLVGDGTLKTHGPEFLVNHDVVVVTFNYRLGPFGFLSTQDSVFPGNNGLKDQLLALQWVNKNIHLFGGDASKITIFGQSAGASSVGYHLVCPKSRGLYRAAILQSGSVLSPWSLQRNPRYYALKTASLLNPSLSAFSTSEEISYTMRSASAKAIDKVSNLVSSQQSYYNAQIFQNFYYAPVIETESEQAFLTEKMYEVISRGDAYRVPIILGITSEESLSSITDVNYMKRLMGLYDRDVKALVPWGMNINNDTINSEVGALIRKIYSGDDLMQNVVPAGFRYMSDMAFTRSVIKHAELQSRYSDVYFYQFSYDGLIGNVSVIIEGAERVGHSEDIGYLWRVHNDMFYNYDLSIFPDKDIITQDRLLTLWTNFAKTLNPTPQKSDLLQNLLWLKVNVTNNDFLYLDINDNLEMKTNPKEQTFKEWTHLFENYGIEPYDTY